MTPLQNNRNQRKEIAESGSRMFKTAETEKRMKPAVERRRSAPTMAINKALSKSRTHSRDGLISPTSPDSKSLVRAFSSPTTAFIMDERVQLTTGLQTQERHLFLFSDVLVITKSKSSTNLKLKNQVRLCEMWTAFCIDEVCERKTTPENSFVIGWPTTNCVITSSSAEGKEKWLSALQWQINEMKQNEHPKKISMKMLVMTTQSGASTLTLMVANTDTAKKVIKMAVQQLNTKDRANNYQLWVISGKEATPYPLIGHEQPFSIIMNCLRDFTAQVERSDVNVQCQGGNRTLLFEDLPKAKQCQFILKPRPQPDIHVTRESTPKTLKKKKSLIDWALRRSSSNQSDSSLTSESPVTPRKLFGLSLPSICKNGNLPKPIMDMFVLLYHKGPSTKGIFRRSANAKTCKELKEKLNSGNEVQMDKESVFVAAAVITDFLRNIPGSVLSSELYEKWMDGMENENEEEKIQSMKNLVDELPEANVLLLHHLFGVLHHIERNSEENQMTAFNLALCIAPNMLWLPSPMGPEEESKCTRKVAILVQFMIENSYRIFGSGLNSLFEGSDVQRGNTQDLLDVDLLQPRYSPENMDSALSDQKRQKVQKDKQSNSIFISLNESGLHTAEESKDIWSQPNLFNEEVSCTNVLEKSDSEDLCELENESLYSCSSVSSLAAIQSIDSARDRCSSEPSVCLSHQLALSHEPVARQSSCDAAMTHGHIDYLQQLKRLQIESQKLLDDGKVPGCNKPRYTYWRSPQINTKLKQPNPHRMNLSTRSSLSSLSSPTMSPSGSSLSSIDSAFSYSDSSVFGRSDSLHFGNSGKSQISSPCTSNILPCKLSGSSPSSVAYCLDDLDWYNEETEKEGDLDCESDGEDSARIPMERVSHSKCQRSEDDENSVKDVECFTSTACIEHDELGTNCVQNDTEELNRESNQERRNRFNFPNTTQFVTLPEEPTVVPSFSKNVKRTKITFYMAPGKLLTLQHMGQERQDPEVGNASQDKNSHYCVLPPSKGNTRPSGQTLKVHIPQTVFYGQDSPLVLQSVTRRQIFDGSKASQQKIIPGDILTRTSSRDSPSQSDKQLFDGSTQPVTPQQCSNNTSNKRHTIQFILPPSVKTTVKDYFRHNEAKHCFRDAKIVESELIRRRQEWQSRRCTDSQLEDFENIIFADESYV
ncbi:rho GTPase-activating protein 20 isoform X1 [Scyliorhinus canicula]|uniref:rho GTPase-activating protein 20 isoform X1 n=2 Tax=Scyliorhinus canicula TaxID=7830 RepID=UPI0018F537EC|nr:rho GTPase-activating protein 20 isoform X1 [Scyliorhinus canicula]